MLRTHTAVSLYPKWEDMNTESTITFRTAYDINTNATDAYCPTQLNIEHYTR